MTAVNINVDGEWKLLVYVTGAIDAEDEDDANAQLDELIAGIELPDGLELDSWQAWNEEQAEW